MKIKIRKETPTVGAPIIIEPDKEMCEFLKEIAILISGRNLYKSIPIKPGES